MADEHQLSAVLGEFAQTMVTDFPIQAILDHLVQRIVEIMPITGAGVTLISPGADPQYIAASNDAALRFEKLQTELGEGPCLAAYHSGTAISVPDLRDEDRFPTFAPRALQAGLAAVFTFPLNHGDHRLGALDLYRDTSGGLSGETMAAAQTLADVATAYLVNAQGRADLEEASNRSKEASLHDGLTGLPNRALLLERLEHAVLRGRRTGLTSAVFFVDLDRFKAVNDTFGHRVGDELLVALAGRLTEVLRPGDTLARVSGDEFVILCEDLGGPEQAQTIVGRLEASLSKRFVVSGRELDITASVGIAFTNHGGDNPDDVIHAADMAMYQAKRAGGGHYLALPAPEQPAAEGQVDLERDVRTLLDRSELHLDYQPIVESVDGCLSGVEALLRWTHPSCGLVSPSVLVPLAERLGLVAAIGRWVLDQASSEQSRWQRQYGVDDVSMSVNVSAAQILAAGFADTVGAALGTNNTRPDLLTLEVTESTFVRDGERGLMVLNDLKDMGVRLALDDFGTGYSSLSYLQHFPIDIVKIDQTFVAGLGRNAASDPIITAVVQLAHGLGMTVVAEGVETAEQHRQLTRLGCDFCQGFYFARPMPAATLDALIHHRVDGTGPSLPVAVRG
jgi:diguanylate cyclase (GGDEF)-like protein